MRFWSRSAEKRRSDPSRWTWEDQSGRTVMITVEGNGVQTVDVYLDGVLYDSQEIDFDALAER